MFDAVILAGGTAQRMGGVDKTAVTIGSAAMLDRVLLAVAAAGRTVVVGPPRPVPRAVEWCREDPPGGGPVAAIAAGLAQIDAEVVLILAADLPFIAPAVIMLDEALAGTADADAAVLVDASGQRNYLAAAWRRTSLRRALDRLPHSDGAAARQLYAQVTVIEVPDLGDAAQDCDTWADVARARRRTSSATEAMVSDPLDAWTRELAAHLGVADAVVDRDLILDVAREAAHSVARPAAPLTTFLVGLAAGMRGGTAEAVRDAAATALRLATDHQPRPDEN